MQKWLPLNYSFVHIQNSLTNLARDNKFFTIFVSKNEVSEAILNTNKRIISRKPLLHRDYCDTFLAFPVLVDEILVDLQSY